MWNILKYLLFLFDFVNIVLFLYFISIAFVSTNFCLHITFISYVKNLNLAYKYLSNKMVFVEIKYFYFG